ncbi:PIG-L deacetylase family protein [Jeotgalibacillus campisalis]|uniref:N-acetylglucosaminylphosphatidylinositol deacetylase family protein n=1 Tax=Jeotgalibacillus campisalis TaxID=220754 RepID=A0A0C2R0A4_9BACL|nr:PIG-L deacetylase family protein [Jeotgalibacillus campisalis]KIL43760.1 N-acetylglucosaminylphosphatidylinositol deacetylase family protein [Jeotgalibacillus campisalis]
MNVLVVAPHADDEVLGAGGTIAKYVDEGHDVYVAVVTSGHPSMFPEDFLKMLRSEALASHNCLGIKETFFLEFPAVMLSEIPKHEINKKINTIIDEVKPDIVYIPHYGDMHLDHFIVSQATMVGVRPIKVHKVLEVYSYETLSETEWNVPHVTNVFIPNAFVNVSNYLDKKIKAMSYFKTQLTTFPHPRSLEAITSLAKLRGSTIGVNAAEAFCLIRRIVI